MTNDELKKELADPRGPNPARMVELLFTIEEIQLISQRAEFISRCLVSSGPIRRIYEQLADVTDHLEACLVRSAVPPQPVKQSAPDENNIKAVAAVVHDELSIAIHGGKRP